MGKKRKQRRKKPFNREAFLEREERRARREMDKARAEIEEGLTSDYSRRARQKSPSAFRSKLY